MHVFDFSLVPRTLIYGKGWLISNIVCCIQILCTAGDITAIRNGEVPLHPAYGRTAADEHEEYGEGVCHCSPPWT